MLRVLLLLCTLLPITAEDRPIAYLNNAVFDSHRTRVYDFIDPVTQRRFLVIKTSDGVAMIEATPVPRAVTTPVELARPVAPQKPVPPSTTDQWEVSRSYLFTEAMAGLGWVITAWETDGQGREFCRLRRPNPHFKLPDVEKPKE